jgi:hypothetical protein
MAKNLEKMKSIVKESLSMDEEMLMWTSYRYCIGRHTYVTDLAYYMANKYYNLLSKERLEFTALDIRREIQYHLDFLPGHVTYEGTVDNESRRPLEDMLQYWSDNNIDSQEKILAIKEISIYHETYDKDAPHKYRVINQVPDTRTYFAQHEIDDLIPWANLASLFDKKHYKLVRWIHDNKKNESITTCFESWTQDYKPVEGSDRMYQPIPLKWKKVYVPVEEYLKGSKYHPYISENIVSVEDYDATLNDD